MTIVSWEFESPPLHHLFFLAEIAQLVEHNLAKVGVAGSSPVVRSKNDSPATELAGLFCMPDLTVASTFVFK